MKRKFPYVIDDFKEASIALVKVEERYPPNDEWTEPDFTGWGEWTSPAGIVGLDAIQKVVREHSVRVTVTGALYYGRAVFTLHDGLEVNTDNFPRFAFVIALEDAYSGHVTVLLWDADGRSVSRDELVSTGVWNLLNLRVGAVNADLWEGDPLFDWTRVKAIDVTCHFPTTGTGSFWLDGTYFTYSIVGMRALDVTVVVKDTEPPIPVAGAKIVYGHLVGVNPETGEETYFWLDGEAEVTGDDGKVVFSELEPDWYGLRVSADGFKEVLVKDIDLTEVDKALKVELEPVSILDLLLPVLVIGSFTVVFVAVAERL